MLVIGSGATAATLVPALAGRCAHVTMLQRSPTYFITGRNANVLADELRQLKIDESWIHEIVRRKILHDRAVFTQRAQQEPKRSRPSCWRGCAPARPDFDVDTHFTPRYRPWRQRIAYIPDADLFQSVREGKASVVTDEIERFVEGVSSSSRAARWRPTSSSPRPASTSACSAISPSPSTASRWCSPTA